MAEIGVMNGNYYLTIHNGSLFLGQNVYKEFMGKLKHGKIDRRDIIDSLKQQDRAEFIQPIIQQLKQLEKEYSSNNQYLAQDELEDYLEKIMMCRNYAFSNHIIVAERFFKALNIKSKPYRMIFDTIASADGKEVEPLVRHSPHNYIDKESATIFKGSASAAKGEPVIIPINMRDGVIIGKGKGNDDWNQAAPHGAGRLMSRTQARNSIDLEIYLEQLKDVKSISINEHTIDEAPDAYKSLEYILERIEDTVEVEGIIKPIYNFKVADEPKPWERKKKK